MRIFIAIQLNDRQKNHVKGVAEELEPFFAKARFSRPENYHITVKFIGEADRTTFRKTAGAVRRAADRCAKFTIATSAPGSFRRKNRHIFYCGICYSRELEELHEAVTAELQESGVSVQQGKLEPHVTIAREVILKGPYPEIDTVSEHIEVDSVCVMESTRVNGILTYIPRFTAELRGKDDEQG